MSINYFRPITTADGMVLSVDNLVIGYHIGPQSERDELARMLADLDMKFAVMVRHWSSLRIGTFRENFSVAFRDGASFWLGLGLNEAKPNFGHVRIEANPARCAAHRVFWHLLGWLNETAGIARTEVKRFDLAIDCVADRADFELLKDHRAYTEFRKSRQDRTQYIGQRSTENRVKAYNKALEGGLSGPLTRLELTIAANTPYQAVRWPRAYIVKNRQARLDELSGLTDTERTLLDGVLAGNIDLTRLGRKTRLKLERYMNGYVQWVTVAPADYQRVLAQVRDFANYPRTLKVEPVHMDELPSIRRPLPPWVSKADATEPMAKEVARDE